MRHCVLVVTTHITLFSLFLVGEASCSVCFRKLAKMCSQLQLVFQNRNWLDQNRRTSVVVKIIYPNLDSALFSGKELVKFFTFKKTQAVNDSSRRCCFRSYLFLILFQYSLHSGNLSYFRDISLFLFHCKGRICICKQLFVDRNILDSDPLTSSYSDPLIYSYSDPLTNSYSDPLNLLLFGSHNLLFFGSDRWKQQM